MSSIPAQFVRTVRERLTTRVAVGVALLVVLLRVVGGEPWAVVGRFLVLLTVLGGIAVLRELPGVDRHHLAALWGVVVAAVAVFAPGFVVEQPAGAVTGLGVLVGGWLILDGVAAIRTGRPSSSGTEAFDELEPGDALFEMQLYRRVAEQLREHPQTPAELADACDLTESRVRTALKRLEATGSAEPLEETTDGDVRWVFDESSVGARAFVDATLGSVVRRLLLPVRELRG